MDLFISFLQLASALGLAAALLWWRKYMPAYMSKKGENLATKEDIAAITAEMEKARIPFATAVEELRSGLLDRSRATSDRQKLYLEFAEAAADVFLSGRPATAEQKSRVLAKYGGIILSAPDGVVEAVNRHMDLQVLAAGLLRSHGGIPADLQALLKTSFSDILLAMRKEAFFPETGLSSEDYRFISIEDAPMPAARTLASPDPSDAMQQLQSVDWAAIHRLRQLGARLQQKVITDAEIAELFYLLPMVPDGEIFRDPEAVFIENDKVLPAPRPALLFNEAKEFVEGGSAEPPRSVIEFVRSMSGSQRWLEVRIPGTERHYGLRF